VGDHSHKGSDYSLTQSNKLIMQNMHATTTAEAVRADIVERLDAPPDAIASVAVLERTWGTAQPRRVFEVTFKSHADGCYDVRARVHNALCEAAYAIRSMHPECTKCYPDYALTAHGRDRRSQLQAARTALIKAGRPPVWRNGVELWAPVTPIALAAAGRKPDRALVTDEEIAALVAAPRPATAAAAAPSVATAASPLADRVPAATAADAVMHD
jgi:hypothetical protein